MMTSRCGLAAVLSALVVWSAPRIASALPFSSSVQRFEADGNAYGSADGVFDLVDEFDDGVLPPNWAPLLGTALESGGVLTVRDPGVTVPLVGLTQEISTVESTEELANGAGNFVVTAYWDPAPLPTNRQFFLQIYGTSPVIEASGLTVSNLDAATAASSGLPTGYSVQFSRVFPLGNQEPPVAAAVPINPSTISGPIVLRLSFDDPTDMLTASFSLDGGANFQSPFPALQAFKLAPDGELLLGAAAIPTVVQPGECPYGIDPAKVRFQRLADPIGQQSFRVSGTASIPIPTGGPPFIEPPAQGAAIAAISGSGHLEAFTIPGGGAPPNAGCGPKDGWSQRGTTYTYKNESGLLPPACTTSANGLEKVKIADKRTRNGTIKFSLLARRTAFYPDASAAAVSIRLGDPGPGSICATTPLSCSPTGNSIKCK
jgi:hypothetical protein